MVVAPDGRPYAWDSSRPIAYTMDPGPLGIFSNLQASQWVADAFKAWGSVEGARLSVEPTAPYSTDITGRNVVSVLNSRPQNVSLVILDSDGSVLNTLFGFGAADAIAGIGFPERFDTANARILQATAIISGRDSRFMRPEWFRGALIEHELGHFLGLTHSQLNPEVAIDGDPTDDHLAPRMSYNEGPNSVPGLHRDDRAWIAALYPDPDASATTGTIRGRVLLPDGVTGLQGIQVVARKDGDERATAVSGVSGYRYKDPSGSGSRDVALWGAYELPGLPPGSYRLAVEQLTNAASVAPVHGTLPGGHRFWRESEVPSRRAEEATLVAVEAGETLDGRDFIVEGPSTPPRMVAEVGPNLLPEYAQTLPLPCIVAGRVSRSDPAFVDVELEDGRVQDVQHFYRVVVSEPVVLTAILATSNPAFDTRLYVMGIDEGYSTFFPLLYAASVDPGTPPQTVQLRLEPGVWFLGVSSPSTSATAIIDYRLTVSAVPVAEPEAPAPNPPRITFATVSNLTQTSLRVTVQTDQDANAVLLVEPPARQFGEPAFVKEHTLPVTGLTRRNFYSLDLASYNPRWEFDALPSLLLLTPSPNSGTTPYLLAGLTTARAVDARNREFMLVARVSNLGTASAANVRVTRLALPEGWRYVGPPQMPVDLGSIGSVSSALLIARVEKVSDTAAPLDLAIAGTYETVAGSTLTFGR
jgi:hypothetical protein